MLSTQRWPSEVLWTCWLIALELLAKGSSMGAGRVKWGCHLLRLYLKVLECDGAFPAQILCK